MFKLFSKKGKKTINYWRAIYLKPINKIISLDKCQCEEIKDVNIIEKETADLGSVKFVINVVYALGTLNREEAIKDISTKIQYYFKDAGDINKLLD